MEDSTKNAILGVGSFLGILLLRWLRNKCKQSSFSEDKKEANKVVEIVRKKPIEI